MVSRSVASVSAGVRARAVLLLFCVAAATCSGHSPNGPSDTLTITCPANVTAESPNGDPVPVQFPAPMTSGGSAPITKNCSPAAGSSFAPGTATVTCNAQDGAGHSASCTLSVQVTRIPSLPSTRFMAFGDSITAGEISFNATMLLLDPSRSYPTDLATLLRARYPQQTIDVFNDGLSGETAVQGSARISADIVRNSPQVLLLLEGVNDLQQNKDEGINPAIDALKFDIRDAQRRGCTVFISTLLPQKSGSRAVSADLIEPMNDKIRALAAQERVVLVDGWQAFVGKEAMLIGEDGLHPTPEGYQTLAQTFFDSIQAHLEQHLTLTRLRR